MAKFTLTANSLEKVMSGLPCEKPVVQVLGHKKIVGAGQGPERFRLLLSDGVHTVSSVMLATQLNDKVTSGQIDINAVVRLDKYICNIIQAEKRVVVVLELTVLGVSSIVGGKIGNPQPYKQQAAGELTNSNVTAATAAADLRQQLPLQAQNNNSNNNSGFSGKSQFDNTSAKQQQQRTQSSTSSSVSQQINKNNSSMLDTPSKITSISSLNPYLNRWTIKARVTQKSSIKTWSNSKGEGKLFSMNLIDQSGEIRATLFKNEVDKFFDMIEVNKVYFIRKAQLKIANKQFSNLNNDFELTFTGETEVIPCADGEDCDDDGQQLPSISFNFVGIDKFEQMQPNVIVDVIAVVKDCGDLKVVTQRQSNKEIKKRDITLVDQSKVQVTLTLWGDYAESFKAEGNPVLAIKGVRLTDFGGRSLSQSNNSQILENPDFPECHSLRGWFDNVGCSAEYSEYKKEQTSSFGGPLLYKTMLESKNELHDGEAANYFMATATIPVFKKDNSLYKACPQPDCNKKVVDCGNSSYRCEKCSKEFGTFKWRLILQMNISDFTESQWVTAFNEVAETILNIKADELGALKDTDSTRFDQVFTNASFSTFTFKLRSKVEKYNDESRLKTACIQATPISYADENKRLILILEKYLQ
ncbi:hypothetical protein HELRODRAFT_114692 [Helobdella robusta]|uniref:Replication protein A subunit n=1 Tax=Helobdella robusta TaxID=6412 RepID=T1EG41_HELRO|nr:hypothetical protein HELRODRAFT_114692 [Helobdella robusta]ESN95542.1 hypothetical protein HELRODRAFT_114692 [Helobdella robusta]